MLEILQFIFASFWHWLGAFLMIGVIAQGIGGLIRITINRKKD